VIPVEQRDPYDEAAGRVGDCWRCCVASVLELPYEEVPNAFQMEQDGEVPSGWNVMNGFLRARGWTMWRLGIWGEQGESPRLRWGGQKIDYHPTIPEPAYWIASVVSPRIIEADGERGLHTVVMQGDRVAWDPHPERELGHLGFVEAEFLLPAERG
jgi:hypothetical protein